MLHGRIFISVCFVLVFCLLNSSHSADVYVDIVSGNDSNSGSSWSNPKKTIGAAVDSAILNDTIHVAKGVYTGGIDIDKTLAILGGYPTGGGIRNPEIKPA